MHNITLVEMKATNKPLPLNSCNSCHNNIFNITAIIPCYNEEEQIDRTYCRIKDELSEYGDIELLFIDDGSTDDTLAHIKKIARFDPTVKYISFTKNFGLEAAFSAGFKYAQKNWIIQFDADLQSPPHEVHKLIKKALEGYDIVFARRQNRQDPFWRRLGSSVQQWIARKLLKIQIPQGASVFRIVRTSVAKKVVALRLGTPYFLATIPLIGASYTCIPTEHHLRQVGKTKWSIGKLINHSFELFFGFSFVPLSLIYLLALVDGTLNIACLVIMLLGHLEANCLAIAGLLTTSLSLISFAIVSRYLKRLILDAKRPNLFYIRESNINILPEDALYELEVIKETEFCQRGC